jgi:hypothetical protein
MKIKAIPDNAIFVMLVIGTCVAAVYIGFKTFSRYPNAVQGIQAFATLCLLYQLYSSPKNIIKDPVDIQLKFLRVIKYIVLSFFLYIAAVWSAQYLIDAISFFLRTVMHLTW